MSQPTITSAERDAAFMDRALQLAEGARWHCPPNPAVGCVITDRDGHVLGEGRTQPAGQAHAEIMALRDAAAQGRDVRGATAYVTLEPCSHHGRTGPCCDALIAAGVARVVAAAQDPNPRVAGQGIARLRAAGIAVDVGLREWQAREMNLGFFSRMARARPWVRVKSAASLDGRTALPNGASQWITSAAARADGHAWRARAGAVLTGIGTVLRDDPLLTVRAGGGLSTADITRQPDLVILDSRLRTPPSARLWQAQGRRTLIYTAADVTGGPARHLRACGAELIHCPGAQGQIDLAALLADLARREVNELHVEAGGTLTGAFLRAELADELLLYQAPLLLGNGPGIADIAAPAALTNVARWNIHDVQRIGPDLRLIIRLTGRDTF